jgi:hypothetical protein
VVRIAKDFYRGTLEASQDLTAIRKLEGQRRLLDWEYWDRRLLFQE